MARGIVESERIGPHLRLTACPEWTDGACGCAEDSHAHVPQAFFYDGPEEGFDDWRQAREQEVTGEHPSG